VKIPKISLRQALDFTISNFEININDIDLLEENTSVKGYKEFTETSMDGKYTPHILYADQINIEQL
tara:strand:- start:616 stop:813 length:198 start_codon:yes stop_codon:yes gene_type:complete